MSQYDTESRARSRAGQSAALASPRSMMLMIGSFQAIAGLAAIFNDEFFVVGRNYTFDLDVTAWGWIHLLLGICLFIAGWGLFSRKLWAGMVAIVLALTRPRSRTSSSFRTTRGGRLLVIAVCIWVMWVADATGRNALGERRATGEVRGAPWWLCLRS